MGAQIITDERYQITVIEPGESVAIEDQERYGLEAVEETTLIVKLAGVINLTSGGVSPGASFQLTAATDLGGHRVATMQGGYADSSNTNHAYALAGLTTQAVSAGSIVQVQSSGSLTEQSWNWTQDEPVYVGNNGMLTQTPPATGFICIIGIPINNTTLLINIQQPIILA